MTDRENLSITDFDESELGSAMKKVATVSSSSTGDPEKYMMSVEGKAFNGRTERNPVFSNWQTSLYGDLFQAIYTMSELPEFDQMHLEPDVAKKASLVLGFLKEQLKMEPPKIINQDREALSFTWEGGDFKRYLTVAEDEIDLMHLSLPRVVRCEQILSEGVDIDYKSILENLSANTRSTSVDVDLED
ncbi:hypothetical protein [Roseibium sp. LAB1]